MIRTQKAQVFERWIRSEFKTINTKLESLYFEQEGRGNVEGIGEKLKRSCG